MKNVLVLAQSLNEELFDTLKQHIHSISSRTRFFFFRDIEMVSEIGGVKANYQQLKHILKNKSIPVGFLNEYSLDEYFANHSVGDIYITPTHTISTIISSASLLGYKGNIYVFGSSKNEPKLSNVTPFVRAFKCKDSIGVKGLNMTEITYDHSKGKTCYYSIDGSNYSQLLKGKGIATKSGVQGYTMACEEIPEYRVKIWDSYFPKRQYEIDEIASMISENLKHPSIAFPIAFVYNEYKEPIGFVMKNFEGDELDIHSVYKMKNPLKVVEQILRATIWMEVHGLFHRDISHNMLIDKNENVAIIDVDSIQYKAFPATASETSPLNALPEKYYSNSLFYNTIDISYTTMALVISAFYDVDSFFGVWNKDGLCSVKQPLLDELRNNYPSVSQLITTAYVEAKPVAVARQLEAISNILNGELNSNIHENVCNETLNDDYPMNRNDENVYDFILRSDNSYFNNEDYTSDRYYENTQRERKEKEYRTKENKKAQKAVKIIYENEPNKFSHDIIWFFRRCVLSLFSTGTAILGMTLEDEWREFVSSRRWVKPLIYTVLTVILLMVISIIII